MLIALLLIVIAIFQNAIRKTSTSLTKKNFVLNIDKKSNSDVLKNYALFKKNNLKNSTRKQPLSETSASPWKIFFSDSWWKKLREGEIKKKGMEKKKEKKATKR